LSGRVELELLCRPASAVVSLHEPVFVDCTIVNRSARPQRLDLGPDRIAHFVVSIEPPTGPASGQLRHEAAGIAASGEVEIAPHAEHRERLLLQRWYRFATPGRYKVLVGLAIPAMQLSSPPFMLEILPRDPERLLAVCETLAARAASPGDAEQSMQAAEALARVADPVAIPYLERLLSAGPAIQLAAIAGLGRIDDPAARALLEKLSQHRNRETAALARRALRGGQRDVTD
jgi:hypothetical protein